MIELHIQDSILLVQTAIYVFTQVKDQKFFKKCMYHRQYDII
jgi:hypothetical protein